MYVTLLLIAIVMAITKQPHLMHAASPLVGRRMWPHMHRKIHGDPPKQVILCVEGRERVEWIGDGWNGGR